MSSPKQGNGWGIRAVAWRMDMREYVVLPSFGYHAYEGVTAAGFIEGLINSELNPCSPDWDKPEAPSAGFVPAPGPQKITVERLFQQIDAFLDCDTVVIADVGDALFGALDLVTCRAAHFLPPAYSASLGFAVPASLAVQLSNPALRPLVLVGDGAFQMTGMGLRRRCGLASIRLWWS